MNIGTTKERKTGEHRVALTPFGVRALTEAGHQVFIERGAGTASGFRDDTFVLSGARLSTSAEEIAETCDLLVKVKEPQPTEYKLLRPGLTLFTFLQLALNPELTRALMASRVTAIAYESIEISNGSRPILAPMSHIAGRMAAEFVGQYLRRPGRGKVLGGIPGTDPARCVVLGCGNVGMYAARSLLMMGAKTTVLSRRADRLKFLKNQFKGTLQTRIANRESLSEELAGADALICGVLDPSGVTPVLVNRSMARSMGEGAVIVDVSIDQGGVCETSRPTSHQEPTYMEEGVIHCCIANMPGAVPHTASEALTNATLDYILLLAHQGRDALFDDPALAKGVNVMDGYVVMESLAMAHGLAHKPLRDLL